VQQRLGGGRSAARCRHGHKGGCRRGGRYDQGRGLLVQRGDDGGGVSLRDAEALGQGTQGTGRGIAEGTQGGQQGGQEDVHPLMGFALAHAEQAPLDHLEGIGLQGDENKPQPGFGRWQGAVLRDGKPAGGPGCAIEAPRGHRGLERHLERRDELLKLLARHAGHIQEC
jgi:hypothetical protein